LEPRNRGGDCEKRSKRKLVARKNKYQAKRWIDGNKERMEKKKPKSSITQRKKGTRTGKGGKI